MAPHASPDTDSTPHEGARLAYDWRMADSEWGPRSKTPTWTALPAGDRWRVTRSLRRGEAPQDSRMAAAAVELGEYYLRRGRGAAAVLFAAVGELAQALFLAAVALAELAALAVAPRHRPVMVARSLEASRAVVGSGE